MDHGKTWKSCAKWPDGSLASSHTDWITTDFHYTEAAAKAVCRMLERDGLGGEGAVFPEKTWTDGGSNAN